MTREETLVLWQQGRAVWNEWAIGVLDQSESLTDTGEWQDSRFADFSGHHFKDGVADFNGFIFPGKVDFSKAVFEDFVCFNKAIFHGEVSFFACQFNRMSSFVATRFEATPDFIGVYFASSPHLLGMTVVRPDFFNLGYREKMDDPEKFLVLRRMALSVGEMDMADHFHGSSIIARRHLSDQWWQPGFWVGLKYQIFSNFGRSLMRPLLGWTLMLFAFAWLYASFYKPVEMVKTTSEIKQVGNIWDMTRELFVIPAKTSVFKVNCALDEGGVAVKALYLSVKNATLNIGGRDSEKMPQVYACLYGVNAQYSKASLIPYIPDSVAFLSILQSILSASFIFLFFLALFRRFAGYYY